MFDTNETVLDLANEFLESLETFRRPSDPEQEQWRVKRGAPEWVREIVRELHEDHLPNDTIYRLIYETALALVDHEGEEDAYVSCDHTTNALICWLQDDPEAMELCNRVLQEDAPETVHEMLVAAQEIRRELLYRDLRDALLARAEIAQEEA